MFLNFYLSFFFFAMPVIEAFFLFEDKEPIFFCYKVCPLYCSPRRRYDDDSSPLIYSDDELPFVYEEPEVIYPQSFHFCKPKPTTTTTTQATTTTTEEPTFICLMCKKKCSRKSS